MRYFSHTAFIIAFFLYLTFAITLDYFYLTLHVFVIILAVFNFIIEEVFEYHEKKARIEKENLLFKALIVIIKELEQLNKNLKKKKK